MASNITLPTKIGSNEYVTINQLAEYIIQTSGKKLSIKHIDGPVDVQARNFSNKRILSTGWFPKWKLADAIKVHYDWIKEQIEKKNPEEGT